MTDTSSPVNHRPRSVLFIFLDGVGLGPDDPDVNPLSDNELGAFQRIAGGERWIAPANPVLKAGHVSRGIDATLGIAGLPQSGTGQATLFTGINCAALAGRHYGPFPHSTSRNVIAHSNVFSKIAASRRDATVAFANAYPERFFSYVNRTKRWTVTTLCCLEAGVRLRGYDDWLEGRAVTADLTAEGWLKLGYNLQALPVAESASRLVSLNREKTFTLFEYFYTDKAGHSLSMERAINVLMKLDVFFSEILAQWDASNDLLLVTSDHGNIEDMSSKSHTRNPVPLIALGPGAGRFAAAESLSDVVPVLLETLEG